MTYIEVVSFICWILVVNAVFKLTKNLCYDIITCR